MITLNCILKYYYAKIERNVRSIVMIAIVAFISIWFIGFKAQVSAAVIPATPEVKAMPETKEVSATPANSATSGNATSGNAASGDAVPTTETQAATDTSAATEQISAFPSPENVEITVKSGKHIISWDKVSGAKQYIRYKKVTTDEVKLIKLGTTTKLKYTDKKIKAGNLYEYFVVATDGTLTSEPSETVYNMVGPDSFELTDIFTKKNKIKIKWPEVTAAKSYVIYKKNASGKYKKLAEVAKNTYTDAKVKKGEKYSYKVSYVVELSNGEKLEKKSKAYTFMASSIDPDKKMVALTFDDGPGMYTQEIVDCLKKNDARATFFVLGCNVDNYKSAVKNAYDIGCEIGNHSYDHKILSYLSSGQVAKQMADADVKIKKVTGEVPSLMRAPGGGVNKTVQNSVGKPIILWSIDTMDWKTRNTDKTISCVMNNVSDGDIVLMHDIHAPTKRAALSIIPALKKKGYQLVTVSELAKYRGYKLQKGSIYRRLKKKSGK